MKSASLVLAALLASGAASAQTATYAIDPSHTFVTWEALHFGTSTARGRFDKKEGTVQFDRAGKTGKVELTIDTASVSTGVAPFDAHLKSKDFFNVAEAPSAKFVSDKFSFSGDKVAEVSGTLTLLGKTGPVTLKASNFNCYNNPRLQREVCGGDFETTIQRSQWGMSYGLPGIPDNIKLLVQVEAIKQ
ncbi:MAG TPA: YceI family protein [Methylibium sp.]|uniref:YceI family protein n=1 Tax=Methylibium sp. TaxID=2067992 RepID=UPI002DB9A20B|nr:YceI family protein [Methylibium sp.]HEU4459005.1 YceI family protein [Methylibium sp.]